jgi:hypothetical protein
VQCNESPRKCLVPVAVVFAVMFAFDWVFPRDDNDAAIPRNGCAFGVPEAEMANYWWVCIITKIVYGQCHNLPVLLRIERY